MAKSTPSVLGTITVSKATYGPYSSTHTFRVNLNQAPNRVILKTPIDNKITLQPRPTFTWFVPADPENNPLHFEIQIDTSQSFDSQAGSLPLIKKISQDSYLGFDFSSPKQSGTGEASYTPTFDLINRSIYYWRVRASDGQRFGEWSVTRKITVGIIATKIKLTADRVYLPSAGLSTNINATFVDELGNVDVYFHELVTFVQSQALIGNFNPVANFPLNGVANTSYTTSGRQGATHITALTNSNLPCDPLILRTIVTGEIPILLAPLNGVRLASGTKPRLVWMVPDDPEGDRLHFKVEVYNSPAFNQSSLVYMADSRIDTRGFSFAEPVQPLSVDAWHDIQDSNFIDQTQRTFSDGQYWWKVTPYDSAYKTSSLPFSFSLPNEMTIVSKPCLSSRPITQAVMIAQLTIDDVETGTTAAEVKHYITNAALEPADLVPWEEITTAVQTKAKHIFTNIEPPAHGWALAVKTVIKANDCLGTISLNGHGAVFDGDYINTTNEDYIGALAAITPVAFQAIPTNNGNTIALSWSYVDLNAQGRRIIDKFVIEVYNPATGLYEPFDGNKGEVLA